MYIYICFFLFAQSPERERKGEGGKARRKRKRVNERTGRQEAIYGGNVRGENESENKEGAEGGGVKCQRN